MYQLVAIDLDGTLLNSYGEVSTNNRESIKKAIEQNCQVVLASGRPIASVKSLALELRMWTIYYLWKWSNYLSYRKGRGNIQSIYRKSKSITNY